MWVDFEHTIWKKIKNHELGQKKFLLTVSGGLDSMALIEVFSNLGLKDRIKVLHFHHGDFENKSYRDQAQLLVQSVCLDQSIDFAFQKTTQTLKSESEFRAARIQFFNLHANEESVFVSGHHLDDLLETRLIKLIRGAGVEGLKSFSEYDYKTFRPFLNFSKHEILQYANQKKMTWADDPTNLETDYLRNWIRNQWLPALNEKHKGGVENLAKSLDRILITEDHFESQISYHLDTVEIQRLWFFSLSTKGQLRALSIGLGYFKKIQFTTGHLEEINKRLDKNQKEHIFDILGVNWVLNAQQIVLRFKD
jgi:tRNA(Ile)-lysidine synthase